MKKLTSLFLAFLMLAIIPCYAFAESPTSHPVTLTPLAITRTNPGSVYDFSGTVPFLVEDYFNIPKNKNVYLLIASTEDCTVEIAYGDVLVWRKSFSANQHVTKYLIKSNMPIGRYKIAISANSHDSCYTVLSVMPMQYS